MLACLRSRLRAAAEERPAPRVPRPQIRSRHCPGRKAPDCAAKHVPPCIASIGTLSDMEMRGAALNAHAGPGPVGASMFRPGGSSRVRVRPLASSTASPTRGLGGQPCCTPAARARSPGGLRQNGRCGPRGASPAGASEPAGMKKPVCSATTCAAPGLSASDGGRHIVSATLRWAAGRWPRAVARSPRPSIFRTNY